MMVIFRTDLCLVRINRRAQFSVSVFDRSKKNIRKINFPRSIGLGISKLEEKFFSWQKKKSSLAR